MAIHSIQGKANFLIGSDREPWHLLIFLGLEECFNWFGGFPIASQRGYGEKKACLLECDGGGFGVNIRPRSRNSRKNAFVARNTGLQTDFVIATFICHNDFF